MSTLDWAYYTYRNGRLFDENGKEAFPAQPDKTESEWDLFLTDEDIHGSIR